MDKILEKRPLAIGLFATFFVCATHFVLACIYHYLTTPGDPSIFFDFDSWSYSFRKDVFLMNFIMMFLGVVVTALVAFIPSGKKTDNHP